MPPLIIPPLLKWTIGTLGGAAIVHWAVQEVRRINRELDRVRPPARSGIPRDDVPTLRLDPDSGLYRPK